MTSTSTTKSCRACDQAQPASAFSPDSRNLDGLQAHCKSCRRHQVAEKRRVAGLTSQTTDDTTSPVPAHPAAGSRDEACDSGPWPQPLEGSGYPEAIITRRRRVIGIIERLHAKRRRA